ncbi:PhzF family isomerase, partial [bacterium]|nr:PhzF family isomerase [bacterium]
YRIYQVDAFTKQKLKGNPAGVVPNADGLTASQMQAIARELNNPETAFLLEPEGDDHDVRVRFLTPTVEVPSCGHATIAAHYIRAVEQQLDRSLTIHHKIGIGVLPVEIFKKGSDYQIFMTQGEVEFLNRIEGQDRETLLAALALTPEELDDRGPIQIVSTGHSKVLVGVKSQQNLHALAPDFNALKELSNQIDCKGYFLFTLDSDDPEIFSHARMFAPAIGISEDPVTGNGNGPLGAYLVRYGIANHDGKELRFLSKQGQAMGREGIAQVRVTIEANQPTKVKVGGDAVIAFQCELEL